MSDVDAIVGVMVPIAAQIACAQREYSYRQRLYPRWVADGKLTQAEATHQLQCMYAILTTLQQVARGERLL